MTWQMPTESPLARRHIPKTCYQACMLDSIAQFLDWFGICVFALSGALVASRKNMDIVGFSLLGCATGIGGGTVRDVVLGLQPVFWVQKPAYLLTCVFVASAAFFAINFIQSRMRLLVWSDAVGLALFSVTGAEIALAKGVGPTIAIAMGVATATLGGIIRDLLGGEVPIILRREIYATAALLGAATFVLGQQFGLAQDAALVIGFGAAFGLRAAAITLDLSLPVFDRGQNNGDS
jgi:uncharacterized membrane protein YeiH